MTRELDDMDQCFEALKRGISVKNGIVDLSVQDYARIESRLIFLLWVYPPMIESVESVRKSGVLFRESTGQTRHGLVYKAMIRAYSPQEETCHATAVYNELCQLRKEDSIHNQFRFGIDVLEIFDDNWWMSKDRDKDICEIMYCVEKLKERR